ncbi:uncharacterized protein Gasu_25580 [Galdieria sulphuraria]|uniref:Uncharacterized protein n=1 Tax=Galdieria sulphuraria TaxID=130081 RepID=M2X1E4_GALSU|nr:uncharacterized protein Gasu_25580 [Galdieria sulphuraria]EME30185.1 hypothetical protein Gasu_25580 [Galdieria sulphuraria]|eukprot:XP_005706705.1 hypothetical protein Gasu_25580 [Galdieria sulphuraria]
MAPNQTRTEKEQVVLSRDEAVLEQEFESFHREVYSVTKPKRRSRKISEQSVSQVSTEQFFDEEVKYVEVEEKLKKQQQDYTKGELTETSTNISRTGSNQLEKYENWEYEQTSFTCDSPLFSEDVESVCSYSHTIRKNRPRKGHSSQVQTNDGVVASSHPKRRKRSNQLKNSFGVEQVAVMTPPKGVDELLDNFLLLETMKQRVKPASRPIHKLHDWQVSKPEYMESLDAKSENLSKPCYSRERMMARLQYMYSKNIAGQFAFDISEDLPTLRYQGKDNNSLKPTRAVKKKTTRRLKLRLYLPT